jgi:hypothetical protein
MKRLHECSMLRCAGQHNTEGAAILISKSSLRNQTLGQLDKEETGRGEGVRNPDRQ